MGSLSLETTANDAIDALHKYDEDGDGRLSVLEFAQLVHDLREFEERQRREQEAAEVRAGCWWSAARPYYCVARVAS